MQTLKFPPDSFKQSIPQINELLKTKCSFLYQYKWEPKVVVVPSPLIDITLDKEKISSLGVTSSVHETIIDFMCYW